MKREETRVKNEKMVFSDNSKTYKLKNLQTQKVTFIAIQR